jgi:hypothetical protein
MPPPGGNLARLGEGVGEDQLPSLTFGRLLDIGGDRPELDVKRPEQRSALG